jgi:hypothetical protein
MNNLIPERRTDKNGKTSTRWVKPSASGSNVASIPAPQRAVSELESNLTVLTDAIKKARVSSAVLDSALRSASNAEIALLATAVQDDPQHFASILIREGGASGRVHWAASMALVYNKDHFLDTASTQRRTVILNNAIRTAYKYINLIDGTEPELDMDRNDWSLYKEDAGMQARVQRFVATVSVVLSRTNTPPNRELLSRALDESGTDHKETLDVLRSNPTATAAQVDFILNGGNASTSSGAL